MFLESTYNAYLFLNTTVTKLLFKRNLIRYKTTVSTYYAISHNSHLAI